MNDTDLETLFGLVQRYSPSGSEAEAATWLVDRMLALGFNQAYVDGVGNPVGLKGSGGKKILLIGHIDTVPGEIRARQEGDYLFGRGTVDAKGPLAAFVDAAAQVEPGEDWQIVVIGAVGEEVDSNGARFIAGAYQPAFAIFGEPCGWDRLGIGYMGSAWSEILIKRPQAHPASGQGTACEQAVHSWLKIQDWVERNNLGQQRLFDRILLSLQGLDSGQDGFTQWAKISFMARLPVSLSPAQWYQELSSIVPEEEVIPSGAAISAQRCAKNSPLVRALLPAIRKSGGNPAFVYKTGTSDLNILAPVWGCPTIVYGPGDSTLDHTPQEHLSLTEYRAAVLTLTQALRRLTDYDKSSP